MRSLMRKVLAAAAAAGTAMAFTIASAATPTAYQPNPTNLYTTTNSAACNKSPCVLYPKSAQLPDGRIVATFEDSETTPVGQTLPVYRSDDDGTTWSRLSDVKAPAYLSADSGYAKYTSNWTNPYLYVLPQSVGSLSAGTLLLASIVSGDDYYYEEQKAANSSWTPTSDGDRKDVALALYSAPTTGRPGVSGTSSPRAPGRAAARAPSAVPRPPTRTSRSTRSGSRICSPTTGS